MTLEVLYPITQQQEDPHQVQPLGHEPLNSELNKPLFLSIAQTQVILLLPKEHPRIPSF